MSQYSAQRLLSFKSLYQTASFPQVFVVNLTEEGRLIFNDFPQLAVHCFGDRLPRPLFCGTRIWNPTTLDWNLHSELMDYFPSEGYNFLLVRDLDNKSAPHLGFFLRQLEEQTEKPVTVRAY